jgi:hypothetical protein
MELAQLAIDILVVTAKVWLGFVFLAWLANKFGITALSAALGKASI